MKIIITESQYKFLLSEQSNQVKYKKKLSEQKSSDKNCKIWVESEDDPKYKKYLIENYVYWTGRVYDANSPKQRQITSVMRMRAIMDFKTKEDYAKKLLNDIDEKCIVFCNTQDQADRICPYSVHSNNPDAEDNLQNFKEGVIDKLSCVLQLNEGINIPELRAGVIMHAYGNERKANQRIGRLLRLNPKERSTVHILCYKNTVDEEWVTKALQDLDPKKIRYFDADELYK